MKTAMHRFAAGLAIIFALAHSGAHAQSVNDLVQLWLLQNGKVAQNGDYSTCQPEGQADAICSWDTGKLGAQPSGAQLQALAATWATQRQATQYPAVIAAGAVVASTGTPALNGTYAIDAGAQSLLNSEISSFLLNGTFTNGQATRAWHDKSGLPHTFTVAQFKSFATAIGLYVDSVLATYESLVSGQPSAWPSNQLPAIP